MGRPAKRAGPAPNPKDSTTWYTVGEVASFLECSRSSIKRWEGHLLHPVIDDRGIHRYSPSEVHVLRFRDRQRRRGPDAGPVTEGEVTAAAFNMFETKHTRNEVIMALQLSPARADELWEQWKIGTFEEAARQRRAKKTQEVYDSKEQADAAERRKRREEAAANHRRAMETILAPKKPPEEEP